MIPVDSPTVAKAEMVSNMILSNDCDSVSISRNIASISTMVLTMMMASERVTIWGDRVRPIGGDMGALGQKRPGRQQNDGKGGDLDTAPGRVSPGTDEHQHHHEQQGGRHHLADIHAC